MPVPSRGRKGSRSRADCLWLPPASSHTAWGHSLAQPLLPGTLWRGQHPTVPRFVFWSVDLGEGGRLAGLYEVLKAANPVRGQRFTVLCLA